MQIFGRHVSVNASSKPNNCAASKEFKKKKKSQTIYPHALCEPPEANEGMFCRLLMESEDDKHNTDNSDEAGRVPCVRSAKKAR